MDDLKKRKLEETNNGETSEEQLRLLLQFKGALQMQLALQRHLHEQLEVERNLQKRIEEQAKLLRAYDQYKQTKANKSSSGDDYRSMNLDDNDADP
ncbi:hypothetical protein QVD17_17658 [Tagetes erecta]|uniref:MYB-CC type transcription factor LHEQLE-containing domain-containing protein n=1 Tax=Tagetes erecta TaxID=13708 RepID=A0AAD8KTM5_TARER|nr:hypothetical protein QVD17_17658 [Tagetes erecta]